MGSDHESGALLTAYPPVKVMQLLLNVLYAFTIVPAWPGGFRAYAYAEYCEKSSNQPHGRLRDYLLCDYDSDVRPKVDHKNATNIRARMILKSFSYHMNSHYLSINSWTVLYWHDGHLKWKPEDYEGIETTHFSTDTIWTPDLSHYNRYEQDGSHDIINYVNCHVTYNGEVACLTPGKYDTLCVADLKNFPYDRQTCSFVLGSWVHTGEEVNLDFLQEPISLQELTPDPEWKLINVTHLRTDGKDACCPNTTFPSLIYMFVLERRGGFLEATAIIPGLGLISMALLLLFLEANELERIVLIVCNIIGHIVFLQYISWEVPNFGDNVPKIILFGRDSMIIAFSELIITVILRNLTKSPEESPNWATDIVTKALESRVGYTVLTFDFTMKDIAKVKKEEDGENIIDNTQPNIQKDCALFAKLVDRLCFVLFLLTYIIMVFMFIF